MKKITLLLVILGISMTALRAQDIVTLKDQTTLNVRVVNVSKQMLYYRLYTEPEGRIHTLLSDKIASIQYQDGTVSLLHTKTTYDFKRNVMAFHVLDLLVNDFTLSYEFINQTGKLGFQIPLAIGYANNDTEIGSILPFSGMEGRFKSAFYTGLNLNIYPTGQGKVKYFMGPSIRFGNGYFETYTYQAGQYRTNTNYVKVLINNGLVISPVPSFSLSALLGLGILYTSEKEPSNEDHLRTTSSLSFNLSYRFK